MVVDKTSPTKKKGKMSKPTLSSGALEVVSRINNSYETKMNCTWIF